MRGSRSNTTIANWERKSSSEWLTDHADRLCHAVPGTDADQAAPHRQKSKHVQPDQDRADRAAASLERPRRRTVFPWRGDREWLPLLPGVRGARAVPPADPCVLHFVTADQTGERAMGEFPYAESPQPSAP